MGCNIITLLPNKFLLGRNFDEIKRKIKLTNNDIDDLGTLICIRYPDYFMVLSDMYELEIYGDLKLEDLKYNIDKIEEIIKEKISNFTFDKTDLMYIN